MTQTINRGALFNASCLALITTAFSFSIRAGILPQLGEQFGLNAEQLGFINSMWFLGFPISMILGGLFYHIVGPANIMRIAFVTHTLGILMTIFADGYTTLLISTLFIGFTIKHRKASFERFHFLKCTTKLKILKYIF